MIIGGEHIAGRHHLVAARHIADIATGLADEQNSGGDVPRSEAKLPEPVIAAGGDIGEVESRRAQAPDAARRADYRDERIDIARLAGARAERHPGADHGIAELPARRDPKPAIIEIGAEALL